MSVSTDARPRIVAVTACPTGIAHSQMAAEALSQAADEGGYEISIEVQGAMGTEGELTPDDLRAADAAVVAADVTVDTDRFDDLPVVNVPVSEAVTDADTLLARAAAAADHPEPAGGTGDAKGRAEADPTADADATANADADGPSGGGPTGDEDSSGDGSPDDGSPDDRTDDEPAGLLDRLRRRFR